MRWQIAQFVFCEQQQSLSSEQGIQQLEPMMVELLRYFCEHSDTIISKQQLIDDVWLGRIVSDNAVSKLITKLRKSLDDDPRQPRFIATFPKKGYKFIAQAVPLVESIDVGTSDAAVLETKPPKQPRQIASSTVVVLFTAIVILVAWTTYQAPHSRQVASYAKAFTTASGDESAPSFSPDGTRVTYMVMKEGQISLVLKDLKSGQIVEIEQHEGMGVGPADWRKDGKQIVYLAASPSACAYYVRDIQGLVLGEPERIYTCPAGSYGKVLFTHDNNYIVFSQAATRGAPYSLYSMALDTGDVKRLNQPEIYIGGNSQFDLHPFDNKLLISSPDKRQWEGFYSLDLDTAELELLFAQDAYTCCGIWSHDGQKVVLIGEHPSYQLVSYDLSGADRTVIYSGSRVVKTPRRHINGVDYLFGSDESNTNFNSLDLASGDTSMITDGTFDELLARMAYQSNRVAYIGFSSGKEEVWLKSLTDKRVRKLTQFDDNRHYLDLVWSPDETHILALTLNEIRLIDVATGDYQVLDIPQEEIRGVSFKTNRSISYSIREADQWQVYIYHLSDDRIVPETGDWQFVQFDHVGSNHLWLNRENALFIGDDKKPVLHEEIAANTLVNGRQFNLRKRGPRWYWYERGPVNSVKSFNQQTGETRTLVQTDVPHFDVYASMLIYGMRQRAGRNLYQTQSVSDRD